MSKQSQPVLSVVVPMYNEAAGLRRFHAGLMKAARGLALPYEIIYVDDGSADKSAALIAEFHAAEPRVRLLKLTRNFGKEIATTAGIHAAQGQAILTLDADGQHPVAAIPQFVRQWQAGAKVVIGIRTSRQAPLMKRLGATLFYRLFRRLSGVTLNPGASDFRLIDHSVQAEFNRLSEHGRITRGLIDWLGHDQRYVTYDEGRRVAGTAPYSLRKLAKLAVDSIISLSTSPLYLVAYIGAVVLPVATILGVGMVVNYCLSDPLHLHATGGAYVMVLMLFLIGILLVSQGIIGLYLSHIHSETQGRPLYVVDREHSHGR